MIENIFKFLILNREQGFVQYIYIYILVYLGSNPSLIHVSLKIMPYLLLIKTCGPFPTF